MTGRDRNFIHQPDRESDIFICKRDEVGLLSGRYAGGEDKFPELVRSRGSGGCAQISVHFMLQKNAAVSAIKSGGIFLPNGSDRKSVV